MKNKKNFSPNVYQGKDRLMTLIQKGISKCWKWDPSSKVYRFSYYEVRKKGTVVKEEKKTFQDLPSAKKWLYHSQIELPQDLSPLFGDVLDQWMNEQLTISRSTTQGYYKARIKYLEPLRKMTMNSIRPKDIVEWIGWLKIQKCHATRTSFEKELSFAKIIFNFHKDRSESQFDNPIRSHHSKMVILKEKSLKSQPILEDDFKKFQQYLLSDRNLRMFGILATLQYYQCLRISEAAAIFKEDLVMGTNPEQNRITVRRKVEWLRVRDAEPKIVNNFKNSEAIGIKESVLHPEVNELIGELYIAATAGLLFQVNGKPLSYRCIQHAFNKAFKATGVKHSSTHILRKGGATMYYGHHGSVSLVQKQLGVTNMKTAQVYARPLQSEVDKYIVSLYEKKKSL